MISTPWGPIGWLVPKFGLRRWTLLGGASFEERSTACTNWVATNCAPVTAYFLRVDDPPNRFSEEINRLTDDYSEEMRKALPGASFFREGLLSPATVWMPLLQTITAQPCSILFDISTLPKRVWLFLLKKLLDSPNIQDIVVCYTKAGSYPEGLLTQDAQPVEALPGYGRIQRVADPTLVVGIGYVAFDIDELIEQRHASKLSFLLPFPPASPASRRNWGLVVQLMPDAKIGLDIKRIHSMDMFAAQKWLCQLGREVGGGLDMVALGPKPHALAMGLAQRRLGSKAQVLYSQPSIYRPNYSIGIGKHPDGTAACYGYCLRRSGIDYW